MPVTFTRANQPELLADAAELTGSTGFMPDAKALGVKVDGEITAIAVFQNLTTSGAEFHFAMEAGGARRDALYGIHRYAFEVLNVPKLTAPIAAWNVPAQIMALKSGFFIAGTIKAGSLDGSDAVLMVLLKDAYRWMPHTQPQPAETAA